MVLVLWHWVIWTSGLGGITTDQHQQTQVELAAFAVTVLGGLAHVVYNQGRLKEQVTGQSRRVDRIEGILDGREAPEAPPLPPKCGRR